MGPPHFPVELTDRIIDFCHNDRKTLSKCALTHTSWLPASRFHLFHTIIKTDCSHDLNRLRSIIKDQPLIPRGRPSIFMYIRTVKIEFSLGEDEDKLKDAVHFANTIRRMLCLRNLPASSVHVNLRQPTNLPSALVDVPPAFPPVSDIVTYLKLTWVTFTPPNDIWSLLSSLPRLQHLELSGIGVKSPDPGSPAETLFNGIPLTTMRLDTTSMGFIIQGLIRVANSLSNLSDFRIVHQDMAQEEVPQLVDAIQGRVKSLRFSTGCYPGDERDEEERPSVFDIRIPESVGRFLSLETLVLDKLKVDGSDVSFEWIPRVLQHLSSPVQKLIFKVTATDFSQLNAIPWASIDTIVTSEAPQFRKLTRVEVLVKQGICWKIRPSIGKDAVCSEIAMMLPALNRLGLLRCNTVGCE